VDEVLLRAEAAAEGVVWKLGCTAALLHQAHNCLGGEAVGELARPVAGRASSVSR
jgi:hypothetical protein